MLDITNVSARLRLKPSKGKGESSSDVQAWACDTGSEKAVTHYSSTSHASQKWKIDLAILFVIDLDYKIKSQKILDLKFPYLRFLDYFIVFGNRS